MKHFAREQWLLVSKVLRIFGFVCFGAIFISLQILTGYYTFHRPRFPQPENGWTTHLQWNFSPPSYGTTQDKSNQLLLFNLCGPFFFIAVLGEGIRKLK